MELPSFYNKDNVSKLYKVNYSKIRGELFDKKIDIDRKKNALVLIACQNEFINSDSDIIEILDFIYSNIEEIDEIFVPMISHPYVSIFSPIFWLDRTGKTIKEGSEISVGGVLRGDFHINHLISRNFSMNDNLFKKAVIGYLESVEKIGKKLIVKNFPVSFGSLNFAIIPSIEEAIFSHSIMHRKQPHINFAGPNPFSEFKSVFVPDMADFIPGNDIIFSSNLGVIRKISLYDNVIFASLSEEISINSICDFVKSFGNCKSIYSNHKSLNGGKMQKCSNIVSEDIVCCKLSNISI